MANLYKNHPPYSHRKTGYHKNAQNYKYPVAWREAMQQEALKQSLEYLKAVGEHCQAEMNSYCHQRVQRHV